MKYSNKNLVIYLMFLRFLDVKAFTAPAFVFTPRIHHSYDADMKNVRTTSRTPSNRNMITPLMEISVVASSDFEVEVFADLAHVLLDFATMFSPNTLALNIFVLCGRVFSILSDLTPDGSITTDELLFQSLMFTLSSYNVVKMFVPMILATMQAASFQDRRMYQSIFRSFGFTWSQYKLLIASGAIEWVEIPPKSTFIMDKKEHLLITYRGSVSKVRKGSVHKYSDIYGDINGRYTCDFIGDLATTKELIDRFGTTGASKSSNEDSETVSESDPQILTTDDRAHLLRINTELLSKCTHEDLSMSASANNLLFSAILSLHKREEGAEMQSTLPYTMPKNGTFSFI